MARRVGLPAPSIAPFGGGGRTFGQYDILDNGSRETGRAFQKAQALWAAGKLDDDDYLAAYEKYVGKLDGTAKINAQQSLDRERYTFARNDIVARIDAGDESAYSQLLAYDRNAMAGLTPDNEEYQRRLGYMRQTQNSIFTNRHNAVIERVNNGQMTTTQYFNWLVGQQGSDVTAGNGALRNSIMDRIDATRMDMANERREKVYQRYQQGDMAPGEFMNYARKQRGQFRKGTMQHAQWSGRLNGAKLAMQDARMAYRWSLSDDYKRNREWLAAPPPGGGKADKTRTIFDGGWKEQPVETAPTPTQVAAHEEYQKEKVRIEAEQEAIERRMGAANLNFIEPRQMAKFYKERKKGVVKGTAEWLALHQKVGEYQDVQAVWDTFTSENGFFPTKVGDTFSDKPAGAKLPGEGSINAKTFVRQLRAQMGNSNGISPVDWKVWAKKYLGDASAKPSPGNIETVTLARVKDMKNKYGSWAMVAKAWADGGAAGENVGDWSADTRQFVNDMWEGMGLGRVPREFKFTGGQRVDPATAHPDINATPGDSPPLETVDAAGAFAGPDMYAIVPGPPTDPRRPYSQGTGRIGIVEGNPVQGMGPGEYDNLYDRARNAFLDGQTSFTVNDAYGVTNYFFPADHARRAEMMWQMDDTRIELKRHEMTQTQQAVNDTPEPSEAQINAAAEAADKFTKAIDTAGSNIVEMAFAGQQGEEGDVNYNPAADMQKIGERTKAAAELMIADAQEMWDAGATTQAVVALQYAEEILAGGDVALTTLAGQLQEVVKSAQVEGADLPEGQQAEVRALVDWRETYGLGDILNPELGGVAGDIMKFRNTTIEPWIQKDSDGMIMFTDDGLEVVEAAGTVKQLIHNQSGPDTFKRVYPDKGLTTTGPDQDFAIQGALAMHVTGQVMSKGQNVVAEIPYKEGPVGYIQLPDGTRAELIGKTFSLNIDGRHQTVIENPMVPGRYAVMEDGVDMATGFIYEAGEGATLDEDDNGNKRIQWRDPENQDMDLMLAFNQATTSYDVVGRNNGGFMGIGAEDEATLIGSLSNNTQLQERLASQFTIDTNKVPFAQRNAFDMLGVQLGLSASQINQQKLADQWRAEGAARIIGQQAHQARFADQRRAKTASTDLLTSRKPIVVQPPVVPELQQAADAAAVRQPPPVAPQQTGTPVKTAAAPWAGGPDLFGIKSPPSHIDPAVYQPKMATPAKRTTPEPATQGPLRL